MIPYTGTPRADTGVTNVAMGLWLFLASEVMLFGSLFSAYALLRTAAPAWPAGRDVLGLTSAAVNTAVLTAMTAAAWRARSAAFNRRATWLLVSTALAMLFIVLKGMEYRAEFAAGLRPATSTFLAMYFTLTGLHALHVVGGAIANVWIWNGARALHGLTPGRLQSVALYWTFVDLVWFVILVLFYLT